MPTLVFLDESGDSGFKLEAGSSRYFTVALVVFSDAKDALGCDRRIDLLKQELGWEDTREFHFSKNSNKVREAFLKAVAPYNFFYYGIVINKDPRKLYGEGLKYKDSFYKYTCKLVFTNARSQMNDAKVVIDKNGSLEFKYQLAKYLKQQINTADRVIREVKMEHSHTNNLLQLADYVAGIINRSVAGLDCDLRKIIAHREIHVQVWPK